MSRIPKVRCWRVDILPQGVDPTYWNGRRSREWYYVHAPTRLLALLVFRADNPALLGRSVSVRASRMALKSTP